MKERLLRALPSAANDDGEFAIAARMWDADIVFTSGDEDAVRVVVKGGRVTGVAPCASDAEASIRISGPPDGWGKMLRPLPPPFYQDIFSASVRHGFVMAGRMEDVGPYYPALRRMIELLREDR